MSDTPYLLRLAERLANGLVRLPEERKTAHRDFILRAQSPDGGFRGREGDSDLYYTSFAVRSLTMLDSLERDVSVRLAGYLRQIDWTDLGVIDLMNWLSTSLALQVSSGIDLLAEAPHDFRQRVAGQLEAVRTSDGGYAKSTEGASGSTYHTFLVVLAYQLIGLAPPRPNALVQFLYDRQRDDGGFVEIQPMRRSGTNPTAAACAILREYESVDDELRDDVTSFLKDVCSDEGGLQANSRVPFADSLSTFTGLLTCQDLALNCPLNLEQTQRWLIGQLEFPTGGFRAATWDDAADVEYTFYGLGLYALLNR